MKILVVHNRYRSAAPSGENVVVDQEASMLASRGHDVALFQRHSDDIGSWSSLRRATLPVRMLWSEESRRGVTAALRDFAPDVVHVHNTFPLVTPSVLYACRDFSIPVVMTVHNYRLGCASGDFFRDGRVCHDCLSKASVSAIPHGCYRDSRASTAALVVGHRLHARPWRNLVTAYVFNSAAQRDLLEPVGLPAQRRFVKYNFVPAPPHHSDVAKECVVSYVGRLDVAKGAEFLMRAWDAFRAQRPGSPLRLVVAGDGDLRDTVAQWAGQHRTVTMEGRVPRETVATILARSRAAIVPSQCEETFGLVAAEAMAAGTAPVATAHGAFPELITPGADGALFPPAHVNALVEILADVDDNPQRWREFGERARQTYRDRFTPEASIDRLIDIYRFAVQNPIKSPSVARPTADQARRFDLAGEPGLAMASKWQDNT